MEKTNHINLHNDIKDILSNFHNELVSAKKFCEKLSKELESCGNTSVLSTKIGKFAKEIPDFGYLKEEHDFLLTQVRMVCTTEISAEDANWTLLTELDKINQTLDSIKL